MSDITSHQSLEALRRLLRGTARLGGAFLFLSNEMTPSGDTLLRLLQGQAQSATAVARRSLESIVQGQVGQTRDILFVGDISEKELSSIASQSPCKIIKIKSSKAVPSHLYDGLWEEELFSPEQVFQCLMSASQEVYCPSNQASALFLDRDDVVVRNVPYNNDPEKVVLMPGVVELIDQAHRENRVVIICSNQSGIGRGKVTVGDYQKVHQKMLQLLAAQGAWIEDTYWATYIEGSILPDELLEPHMRKPRSGMFVQARSKWNINMSKSRMIGDSATDLIAAFVAEVEDLILLHSEKFAQEKAVLEDFQEKNPKFRYREAFDLKSV